MRSWYSILAAAVTLAALGCGGNETKAPADAGTSADTTAATDTADVIDVAVSDVPVVTDLGTPDTAPQGKSCAESIPCLAACPVTAKPADDPCVKKCVGAASAAASASLNDFQQCAVQLCADATDTAARNACAWTQCYDKVGSCAGFGAGDLNCTQAAACIGRCTVGDVACALVCLVAADKPGVTAYKDVTACITAKCGGTTGTARALCIQDQCQDAAKACKGIAGGLDCTFTESCLAKCPLPVPGKPNDCQAVCKLLASPVGLAADASYTTCKEQCEGVLNKFDCVLSKCPNEQTACFTSDGTENCQSIYNCVKNDCQGLGGNEACIAGCVTKGSAKAKDAWVHFEGCLGLRLNSAEAKNAKCSFPYDEASCLNVIEGFCGGESSACKKPQ